MAMVFYFVARRVNGSLCVDLSAKINHKSGILVLLQMDIKFCYNEV
jgi:hypothetical protein